MVPAKTTSCTQTPPPIKKRVKSMEVQCSAVTVHEERQNFEDQLSDISEDNLPPIDTESEIVDVDDHSRHRTDHHSITYTKPSGHDTPEHQHTLIIGSSILKGIRTRGLYSTAVRTHRGARVNTIRNKTRGPRGPHRSPENHVQSLIMIV